MGEYGEMDKKREGVKQRKAEGGRESQTQPKNVCLLPWENAVRGAERCAL